MNNISEKWNSFLLKHLNQLLFKMRAMFIQENTNTKIMYFYILELFFVSHLIILKYSFLLKVTKKKHRENELLMCFARILTIFNTVLKQAYKQNKIKLLMYEVYRNHNVAYIMNNITDCNLVKNYLSNECEGNPVYGEEEFNDFIKNNRLYSPIWNKISYLNR